MPALRHDFHACSGGYVRRPRFEEYAEKYSEHFVMKRRDGIIELRMHTAARRLTHAIVQRPWKRRLVQDFGFGLAHELFGSHADKVLGETAAFPIRPRRQRRAEPWRACQSRCDRRVLPMSMRAITLRSFGGPEVLELTTVDRPQPLPTEVLIRVRAVGINRVEPMVRAGDVPGGELPLILGSDISGVVEELGVGTTRFRPGDEVYGMPFFPRPARAYAEYVAAPSRQLARKPASIDHVHAAALPMAGLTAWQCLVDVARVGPGQRVLIHGAGGGVGHVAVQIAKARGAYVIGTASVAKHDFVRGLGADEMIDYRSVDFAEAVRDVDVVLVLVGRDYTERSLRCLRPGGLLVTAVDRSNCPQAAMAEAAGRRFASVVVEPDYVALEKMAELVEKGHLRPYVSHVFTLQEVGEAHEMVTQGDVQGKVVLTV